MINHITRSRLLAVGGAAGVLVGGIATYLTLGVSQVAAVGTPEYACSGSDQQVIPPSIPPLKPVAITGAKVTVNNGTAAHNVELTFNADATAPTSPGTPNTLQISWGLDGHTPTLHAYGPADLVSTPPNTAGGTVINVAPDVAAGAHTFQAYVTPSNGVGAQIEAFCAIAQAKSN